MKITHAALAAINTAFNAAFNQSLNDTPSTWNKIAMLVNSTTRSQSYPKLDDVKGMREWIGDRHIQRLTANGFEIVNRKFENTFGVSVDDIEDDQIGLFSALVRDSGQAAAELPDELVYERLMSGFDTPYYDGQNFFDVDHPVEDASGKEQSVSNYTDGTGPAWFLVDTTRSIKPLIYQERQKAIITSKTSLTDDNVFTRDEFLWGIKRRGAAGFGAFQLIHASKQPLTPESYAAARKTMLEMPGAKGRKINLRPNLLLVSPSNEEAAREILLAERTTGGKVNVWRNTAELHVETRLKS